MDKILKILLEEKERFIKLLHRIEKTKITELDGCLVINTNKKKRYYHQTIDEEGNRTRKFLKTKDKALIKALAQKPFFKKSKKFLIRRIKNLDTLIKDYKINSLDNIYKNQSDQRRAIFGPLELTNQKKISLWKSQTYTTNSYPFGEFEIKTKKGERVRSKSEKIIADRNTDFFVEYKYECPLYLDNGQVLYPDFTFYDPISDKEIYWEHFGMMNEDKYLHEALNKIETYIKNGYYLGERLIVTFETTKKNVGDEIIDILINRYLRY